MSEAISGLNFELIHCQSIANYLIFSMLLANFLLSIYRSLNLVSTFSSISLNFKRKSWTTMSFYSIQSLLVKVKTKSNYFD